MYIKELAAINENLGIDHYSWRDTNKTNVFLCKRFADPTIKNLFYWHLEGLMVAMIKTKINNVRLYNLLFRTSTIVPAAMQKR